MKVLRKGDIINHSYHGLMILEEIYPRFRNLEASFKFRILDKEEELNLSAEEMKELLTPTP